jgi:Tfp pilus assembly protein PilN
MHRALVRRPAWTQLLDALARERPEGLYFERIGSSPPGGAGVQVAMAGWAEQERGVTDLIARLQSKSLLSGVELKVMERDEKRSELVRFKVVCILKLSEE